MLYFVRHGRSAFNSRKIMCGRSDCELTHEGIEQADLAGVKLENIRLDVAYCSPLIRTRQTAIQILKHQKREVPLFEDARLLERDLGYLEGKQCEKMPDINKHWTPEFDCAKYHCETMPEIYARLKSFIDDIAPLIETQNVLVVGHSGVARIVSAIFEGLGPYDDLSHYFFPNCAILQFARKN